jgi:uncharacterized protein (TIGR04255 family)
MSEFPELRSSPIVEAIFDVRVVFPKPVPVDALAAAHQHFKERFPIIEPMEEFEIVVGATEDGPKTTRTKQQAVGCRFLTHDRTELLQFRNDGFTYNCLSPYRKWGNASNTANTAWGVYDQLFKPRRTRVALRYINQILLPYSGGMVKLEDYLTATLPAPPIGEIERGAFIAQSVIRCKDTQLEAKWVLATQPILNSNSFPILLDIDVFALGEPALENDVPHLWEKMRSLKNRLFFASLTNKAIELFQ